MLRIFLFPRCTMSLVSNVGRRMRSKLSTRKRAAWWWSSSIRFFMRTLMRSAAFRRLRFWRDPALAVLLMSWSRWWHRRWIRPKSCLPIWPASVSENQGEEGAYAGVECDDACLGLALTPFRLEGYCEVILAVVQGQPTVLVTVGQLLGHAEVSQDGAIGAAVGCCPSWYVAPLLGVFAAAEADLGVGFIQSFSLCLGLGQLPVGLFAAGNGTAGVTYGDALDLVGGCFEPFGCSVDDGRFDALPVDAEHRVYRARCRSGNGPDLGPVQ